MYKKWNVKVNDVNHVVEYDSNQRKAPIIIDGKGRKFKSRMNFVNMSFVDESLMIDGKEVHLVFKNLKPHLAVDGVYLESGEKYEKLGDTKNLKGIFIILGIVPIIACLLLGYDTSNLIGKICTCLAFIIFMMMNLHVPESKVKCRIMYSTIILILEYLVIFRNC